MNLNILSVSQLSEILKIDRRTATKHLGKLNPYKITKNAHLYFAPIAIAVLLEKTGRTVDWSRIIVDCLNSQDLVVNPKSNLSDKGDSNG